MTKRTKRHSGLWMAVGLFSMAVASLVLLTAFVGYPAVLQGIALTLEQDPEGWARPLLEIVPMLFFVGTLLAGGLMMYVGGRMLIPPPEEDQ